MRAKTLLVCCLTLGVAVLSGGGAAVAQPIGSLVGREPRADDADAIAEGFATCYVRRRPEVVRRWLETLPGSAAEDTLSGRYNADFSACLDHPRMVVMAMRFKRAGMRQRLAAALLRVDFPVLSQSLPLLADQRYWSTRLLAADPSQRADLVSLYAAELGACIARADWANSARLVSAARNSPEEMQAVRALRPSLPSCVVAGRTLTIDRPQLRAALTEAVYHIMNDARPADSADQRQE